MNSKILQVEGLTSFLGSREYPIRAVDGITFDINQGETFALVGESGCGKSMTALSLMRLLPTSGRIIAGSVRFGDRDLLRLSETQMRSIRGAGISMIFQEPMTSLNPVLSVGRQILESLAIHQTLRGKAAWDKAVDLLRAVGIPRPEQVIDNYPHQLSGGMKQRVVIAIALANEPKLLIADEPTTALDVTIQAQVLDLILELQKKRGMAVMLITHDLGVVNELADKVAVMYAGQIVEENGRETFFADPAHPYSQKLFDSLPGLNKRNEELDVIHGFVPSLQSTFDGCRFFSRCHRALTLCEKKVPVWSHHNDGRVFCHLYSTEQKDTGLSKHQVHGSNNEKLYADNYNDRSALLSVDGLKIHFPIKSGLLRRTVGYVRAVDGVTIEIPKAKTLALVGESGCGKTTVGKGILQLIKPTSGKVMFEGMELTRINSFRLREKRSDFQIIFQDPYSSMNPRMLVGDIIAEGLRRYSDSNATSRRRRVRELLEKVGLPADSMERYPHEFSGGQRQRISIARALAVDPKLIVCDEPTSALDVSVQAQILNLLKDLQSHMGISYLFITHDISVVAYLAHEVAVMYLGRIVEYGPVDQILSQPKHPYTQALLSAVPQLDVRGPRLFIRLTGDMPSPSDPPSGCFFHPRCSQALDTCRSQYPPVTRLSDGHLTNCHLYTAES
ncbi:MAG: ABC transporter ATP-binding protein [Arenicellales bacterium]|nr:ABC transporter ATP-binding protein [Arenicellales bacterium]